MLNILLNYFDLTNTSFFAVGLFYIMCIGSIYGNIQAFLAVALSSAALFYGKLQLGHDAIALLYDTTFLFQIAAFILIGLLVGYSVQQKNDKILKLTEQYSQLQRSYQFLEEIHIEVRDIKDELQLRLKNNEDSFGKIYSIIKELDDLEPEKIFMRTVKVVEKIMRCEDVSIYVFDNTQTFLRLVAHSEQSEHVSYANSLSVKEREYIQQIIETGKQFVNYQLLADTPLMSCPIYYQNKLHAIISIHRLPFESLSKYHENLFFIVKELIQTSLGRAIEFVKLSEHKRFYQGTNVLKKESFYEVVQAKEIALSMYKIPYILLHFTMCEEQMLSFAVAINKVLRTTDYVGYADGELLILLSNTKESDLPFIADRFKKVNIPLDLINGKVLQ